MRFWSLALHVPIWQKNFLFIPIANNNIMGHYFTTKKDIFLDLLYRCVSPAARRLRDISTQSPPPLTVGDLASTLLWVSPDFLPRTIHFLFVWLVKRYSAPPPLLTVGYVALSTPLGLVLSVAIIHRVWDGSAVFWKHDAHGVWFFETHCSLSMPA